MLEKMLVYDRTTTRVIFRIEDCPLEASDFEIVHLLTKAAPPSILAYLKNWRYAGIVTVNPRMSDGLTTQTPLMIIKWNDLMFHNKHSEKLPSKLLDVGNIREAFRRIRKSYTQSKK